MNAQLVDGTTGGHVWADRYDGGMKNVFSLQDKVTRNVVSALAVELTKEDTERIARRLLSPGAVWILRGPDAGPSHRGKEAP